MAASKIVRPAGTQLSGPTVSISRTIQQMPKSGLFVIGVLRSQGDENLRVGPNDPSAASIEEIGMDSSSNARWFQLISKRTGNVMVEARSGDGTVVDYFQLAMPNPPRLNLPTASSSMEFEIEPDDPSRPGQINLSVYSPMNDPDYVERRLQAVGFSIYLGGCHLYCDGLSIPVLLPDSHIDFTVGTAVAISTTVYSDRAAADAALQAAPAPAGRATRYAFYRGAGGALIVPTIFCPVTTPRTIKTLLTARRILADEVQKELVMLALSIVGGMVLRSILTRIVRVGSDTADPPVGDPPPMKTPSRLPAEAEAAANLKPPPRSGARVLVVGPETEEEFAYALRVNARGGKATAVNPARTDAASRFVANGGDFVQNKVESLPQRAEFDIIREDYPYPTGNYVDTSAANARISRLKPGGSWVVVTEKPDFADALEAAGQMQGATVTRSQLPPFHEGVPVSAHPRDPSRIAVVITKKL